MDAKLVTPFSHLPMCFLSPRVTPCGFLPFDPFLCEVEGIKCLQRGGDGVDRGRRDGRLAPETAFPFSPWPSSPHLSLRLSFLPSVPLSCGWGDYKACGGEVTVWERGGRGEGRLAPETVFPFSPWLLSP